VAELSTSGGGRDCVGRPGRGEADTGGGASVRAGESARAFLTVSNSNLKLWCRVADVDVNTIVRTYCQGGKVGATRRGCRLTRSTTVVKRPLLAVP
jgi:hypothetical protein